MEYETVLWKTEEATKSEEEASNGVTSSLSQHFKKYESKPWDWIKTDECDSFLEENIMKDLIDWIQNSEIGVTGLLMALEPFPSSRCATDKCIFMHEAKDESLDTKEKTEHYVLQRLDLVQQLVSVYKKARRDIEQEHQQNQSSHDPDCDRKRATATKKIVDMMIKQFALEYLYLKTFKIDNEIEATRCRSLMKDRLEHLTNVRKYTSRTAEKLRFLLNKECLDVRGDTEKYFEENVLKNMARLYLEEIKRFTASPMRERSEGWLPDHLFQMTLETGLDNSESIISDISMHSELVEINDAVNAERPEEFNSKPVYSKLSPQNYENEIIADNFNFQSKLEETIKSDNIRSNKMYFACQKVGSLHFLDVERIQLVEEMKKELWLIDAFRYFTTQINPLLNGKVQISRERNIFDFADSESLNTFFGGSSDISLQQCLVYYAGKKRKESNRVFQEQSEPEIKNYVSVPSDYSLTADFSPIQRDAISSSNLFSDYVVDEERHFYPNFSLKPDYCVTEEMNMLEEYDTKTELKEETKERAKEQSFSRTSSIPSFVGALTDIFASFRPCADKRSEGHESSDVSVGLEQGEIADRPTEIQVDEQREFDSMSDMSNPEMTGLRYGSTGHRVWIEDGASLTCSPPSLDSVIRHFIDALLDKSDPTGLSSEEKIDLEEPDDLDESFHLPYLESMFCSECDDAHVNISDSSHDAQQRCAQSNSQYMKKHPEMFAIISLILREVTMRRPSTQFIGFIKDLLFQETFAERLSSYLEINNKDFRRRINGGKNTVHAKCTFRLDKSSLDHWRDWGVDYASMSDKYCTEDRLAVEEQHVQEAADPWNLDVYFDDEEAPESPRDPDKDARREKSQIAKLADTLDWGLPPDTRSSCQKQYLSRYVYDRQKKAYVKIPPADQS